MAFNLPIGSTRYKTIEIFEQRIHVLIKVRQNLHLIETCILIFLRKYNCFYQVLRFCIVEINEDNMSTGIILRAIYFNKTTSHITVRNEVKTN